MFLLQKRFSSLRRHINLYKLFQMVALRLPSRVGSPQCFRTRRQHASSIRTMRGCNAERLKCMASFDEKEKIVMSSDIRHKANHCGATLSYSKPSSNHGAPHFKSSAHFHGWDCRYDLKIRIEASSGNRDESFLISSPSSLSRPEDCSRSA